MRTVPIHCCWSIAVTLPLGTAGASGAIRRLVLRVWPLIGGNAQCGEHDPGREWTVRRTETRRRRDTSHTVSVLEVVLGERANRGRVQNRMEISFIVKGSLSNPPCLALAVVVTEPGNPLLTSILNVGAVGRPRPRDRRNFCMPRRCSSAFFFKRVRHEVKK